MLALVVSDNFLQLFFGWEGVGLCSYLLIGFWYKTANNAAIKAFIVNRVGDFGLASRNIFNFFIFWNYKLPRSISNGFSIYRSKLTFLGLEIEVDNINLYFLIYRCNGKISSVFITHVVTRCNGRPPVSALIHAATMVTAGVFLVVKCSPIFEYSQVALNLVTVIGIITAIFAASVALVQNDIKKIVAYSTCSQLGYMFFAAGVGAYNVAMFHLFTHAFFKALLFLGSGSVIHAFNDEQDIRNMGGVSKKLPYTYISMLIGTLALTGFPFLSGFYSKDAIIEYAYLSNTILGNYAVVIGIFTAFLTSLYSWRLFFKTFHGSYNNKKTPIEKTHESPLVMLIPLFFWQLAPYYLDLLLKRCLLAIIVLTFGKHQFFFLDEIKHESIPTWFLFLTPAIVIISIPISYYYFYRTLRFKRF